MYLTHHAARLRVPAMLVAALVLTAFSAEVKAASFETLYSFPADAKRGKQPVGSMARDAKGALYGVTSQGGDVDSCGSGCGVIYQLKPASGGAWKQKVLYAFKQDEGYGPYDGLIMGPDGALYGAAPFGGPLNGGAIYRLAPPAAGESEWSFEVLHTFDGASGNDATPIGPPMFGKDGALYGMNWPDAGGTSGTIFRLKRTNTGWSYRALYHFADNERPVGSLVEDDKGRLYGVGFHGGANDAGVLFRLSPPPAGGSEWTYKVLHNFGGNAVNPSGSLVLRDGALYGQANASESGADSVVFRFTLPSGFEVIHREKPATQGANHGTGVALDAQGALYGVNSQDGPGAAGTLFKLVPPKTPGGSWGFRLLHAFTQGPDGGLPNSQPLLDPAGNVYVNTQQGGEGTDLGAVIVYRP